MNFIREGNHNKFLEEFLNTKHQKLSVAPGDRKQFQYLQIVFNNKTRSIVFIKLPNSVIMPL